MDMHPKMDLQASALDRLAGKSLETKQAVLDAVLARATARLKAGRDIVVSRVSASVFQD